eukprot:m.53609 g.53609  ORF g.53609 m.53609 type:complete len:871 (-) comp10874_c0_seq2:743-3355(-)
MAENEGPVGVAVAAGQSPRTKKKAGKDGTVKIGKYSKTAEGDVSYKDVEAGSLSAALQMGVRVMVSMVETRPKRDLLQRDFQEIEVLPFPKGGSPSTPVHRFDSFSFSSSASYAFRLFRDEFEISAADFLVSVCNQPLRQLSNPGASGSLFFLTADDQFIIKTVSKGESRFMLRLLPGYYMNLVQNKRTLLPKFFGLFMYRAFRGRKIRFVVMNNILPTNFSYHLRYDLKGSTFKRFASEKECQKENPCYKDLDFNKHHKKGFLLNYKDHENLLRTVARDVLVLESFQIMDYSLLLGVHRIGIDLDKTKQPSRGQPSPASSKKHFNTVADQISQEEPANISTEDTDETDLNGDDTHGGIKAYMLDEDGKKIPVLLFLGIIDILQSFVFRKRMEHRYKKLVYDGNACSVHKPEFYRMRFEKYMKSKVFREDEDSKRSQGVERALSPRSRRHTQEHARKFFPGVSSPYFTPGGSKQEKQHSEKQVDGGKDPTGKKHNHPIITSPSLESQAMEAAASVADAGLDMDGNEVNDEDTLPCSPPTSATPSDSDADFSPRSRRSASSMSDGESSLLIRTGTNLGMGRPNKPEWNEGIRTYMVDHEADESSVSDASDTPDDVEHPVFVPSARRRDTATQLNLAIDEANTQLLKLRTNSEEKQIPGTRKEYPLSKDDTQTREPTTPPSELDPKPLGSGIEDNPMTGGQLYTKGTPAMHSALRDRIAAERLARKSQGGFRGSDSDRPHTLRTSDLPPASESLVRRPSSRKRRTLPDPSRERSQSVSSSPSTSPNKARLRATTVSSEQRLRFHKGKTAPMQLSPDKSSNRLLSLRQGSGLVLTATDTPSPDLKEFVELESKVATSRTPTLQNWTITTASEL